MQTITLNGTYDPGFASGKLSRFCYVIGDAVNGKIVIDGTNTTGTRSVTLEKPETITTGAYV